ncbi:PilN domain-containing protein [Azoarcus sp. L1K30]|uniref:PilN domain-containing protein n=1 Tax=Azoarcus sp. L1K30 TaxID=2820277 RepID=UPI001B8406C9|nr:PilN domain-containing protein [Azoarcus sp. L1K30]MBR0567246.1 PilN domain-containing protein [Azoarcus sp. L1K30]
MTATARALSRDQLQLFGYDLGAVADFMRMGWDEALHLPMLAWLTPQEPVRVLRADGSEFCALDGEVLAAASPNVRCVAIELDEDDLLRRSLVLPPMADAELRAAIELEASSASPFAAEDLAWTYRLRSADAGMLVDLVLTSKRRIAACLDAQRSRIGDAQAEVWAPGQIAFPGYGENTRHKRTRRARARVLGVLGIVVLLVAGILLTPTLQLRERAIEAQLAYTALVGTAAPQAALRERIVAANERIAAAQGILGQPVSALALINTLTQQLPDDTVLNLLEIRGDKVRMAGQTDNAAGLMQKLGAQPSFRDVRAPSASARAGTGKESFTIEYTAVGEAAGS